MSRTIYFIAPYPQGQAPSQRFRFEQYFSFLEEQGFKVEFHSFLSNKTWDALYKEGTFFAKAGGIIYSFIKRFKLLFQLKNADYIFIHREASMIGPPLFEWFIAKVLRRKYIYDFDDAIWLPNYSDSNAKFHWLKAYWKIKKIINWADIVVAGNTYLKEYANQFNDNTQVIPTTVDLQNVHNLICNHEVDVVNIGWTGTHTTMGYLKELIDVFIDLDKSYQIRFTVISNQKPDFDFPNLHYIKWKKETEIEDLSKINIGIMPLIDSPWERGKCGFKGLQYMSLGIPAVLSPVGVNKEIIQDGVNGFLCESLSDWKEKLALLINDKELRIKIGNQGRIKVEKQFSVEENKNKYLKLFNP